MAHHLLIKSIAIILLMISVVLVQFIDTDLVPSVSHTVLAQPKVLPLNSSPQPVPQQVRQQVLQQRQPIQQRQKHSSQHKVYPGKSVEALMKALPRHKTKRYEVPQVQIAIVLDVSGSMNGLINQARSELWKVINTFNGVAQNGKEPEVRVALYSYGTSNLGPYELHLNQLVPLSTDLDRVSEVLFSLKTSGSSEFCGASILAATRGQAWSSSDSDLKAIIIAGNESFRQGPIEPQVAFKESIERGILTHTIHCGSPDQGIRDHWREGAQQGEGQFMNINHNAQEQYIPTPFDDQIQALNTELNTTYLPYGKDGARGKANQLAQDANAAQMSKSSSLSRVQTKSGRYYSNAKWDLVDAYDRKTLQIDQLSVAALPKEMHSMSKDERLTSVKSFLERRQKIQKKITQLHVKREEFLSKARAEKSDQGDRIDSAMIKALRDQAQKLGFIWSSKK